MQATHPCSWIGSTASTGRPPRWHMTYTILERVGAHWLYPGTGARQTSRISKMNHWQTKIDGSEAPRFVEWSSSCLPDHSRSHFTARPLPSWRAAWVRLLANWERTNCSGRESVVRRWVTHRGCWLLAFSSARLVLLACEANYTAHRWSRIRLTLSL